MASASEFRRGSWLWMRRMARERVARTNQATDSFFGEFVRATQGAALFELTLRMLADATLELQRFAFDDLGQLAPKVVEYLEANGYPQEECALIVKSQRVRNKLLHADFSRATGQLVSLGVELADRGVTMISLDDGATLKVNQTKTADGRIFGWLLECATSGAFAAARRLFYDTVALVQWVLERNSRPEDE